jgi:hypothetical protein
MGAVASSYFKVAAAGTKSLHRETVRLVFFAEVYGAAETAEAMTEVMASGHVGADYVEYVLRQKKGPSLSGGARGTSTTRASTKRVTFMFSNVRDRSQGVVLDGSRRARFPATAR